MIQYHMPWKIPKMVKQSFSTEYISENVIYKLSDILLVGCRF